MSILVRIIDYIFDRSIRVTLLELLESEERMIDFFDGASEREENWKEY